MRRELGSGFPIQLAMDMVDIAFMRMEPGCRELPGEFLLILARLLYDHYELFPRKEASCGGFKAD